MDLCSHNSASLFLHKNKGYSAECVNDSKNAEHMTGIVAAHNLAEMQEIDTSMKFGIFHVHFGCHLSC